MYVPEFWCGVIATILFEIAIIVAATLYHSGKKK